ncbi:MAG TPA: IS110 family transposase [Chromatiales bacterium]|nr:IS110 family transposase [Chromatiales bacterium]
MAKRRYKSEKFKQVDWDAVRERIAGRRIALAVDVAKEDFVASLMDVGQAALLTFSWRHPMETGEVLERIRRLERICQLEVVLEPSGTYGDVLVWQLQQAGIALYRVSPKRVHDAAEVFDGVPSLHDAKAAHLIGRLHLQGASQPWQAPSEARRAMKALESRLNLCKRHEQASCNRLEALLSRHWPELLCVLPLGSMTLAALIGRYGTPAAVACDPGGAAELMRRVGGVGLSEEKIQAVLDSAGTSLGVPAVAAERAHLQWLADEALAAHRAVRQIEREIERHVVQDRVLTSLAMIVGKVSAAVLMAALGSPLDYPEAGSYLKAYGLNLKERSSGKHQGQLKITKRGSPVGRFYLYFAALRLIARDPVVKQWYALKRRRPGAVKTKCVIALMRKLAKALWHAARGAPFDTGKLFNLKAVAAA